MPPFFDITNTFITVFGYEMSHLEFWATLTGGIAVWLSAKENVWSWIIGLLNVVLAFVMFYQIQLYPDMLLQVFFFVTNIIGFWQWKFPKQLEANENNELIISKLSILQIGIVSIIGVVGTYVLGTFAKNLHEIAPLVFNLPSSFPYIDSFILTMSVMATFMLIRKKVEAWWIWLGVDLIATYLYYIKDVKVYALLYAIFCVIAIFGAIAWTRKYLRQERIPVNGH
jgi:nicotinamide mononucleotide transporter